MLVAGCGGAAAPGPGASPAASVSERDVRFRDEGTTPRSGGDSVAIDGVRAGAGLRITAYQGEQSSGGYTIRIERITRAGTELRVHARFTEPAPGSFNTMALTSPAHTVAVDETADVVVLYDSTGAERARARPR